MFMSTLFCFCLFDYLSPILVVNLITVGNFAFLFICTLADRSSDSMTVQT